MAEERRTFKWGDQEYLLDDLLKLHASYENSYYDFARNDGKYDDNALMGLRKAITNRINAVKSGEAFDSDGSLSTDIADNTTIQTQKKGLLRKEKYVDQDNTAWAKHYLNKLVGKLNPYEKAKKADSKGWDMAKHGFGAYLTGQGLNAQEIFEKHDLRDEENPDSPRSFAQRHELLRKHLTGYRDWLTGKGFDFTKNDNEWDDTFLSDLNNLLSSEKFDNNNLAASLRKLGAGDSYTTAFTSDKYDLSETAADAKKAKADKERKAQVQAYNDDVAGKWSIFSGLTPQSAQMNAYMGQTNGSFYWDKDQLGEWARNNKTKIADYEKRYNSNRMDAEAAQYVLPFLQANGRLKEAIIDGKTYVYDPRSINRDNNSFIAIDTDEGKMTQRFLYDIEAEKKALQNKYLQAQGASRYQLDVLPFQDGGVISMQTGGEFSIMDSLKEWDKQDYEKRAKEKGISAKELKEAERTPYGDDETILHNSQFTGNDLVQMATMATNLGSMFLDPLSGAAVGAGASVVDFFNDINRDGFQGNDAWNLVKNLGMDALGVVPIIGDTFGTLGKVKKGLLQIAPKAIGYLGMLQGVANSPQIIDSFTKILDERDMTTSDWQNVANGLNLIVSGTRMGKHALNTARAKKAAKTDMLQVEVTDKKGNTKMLVISGDDADAIRKSDHSVKAVNDILQNIKGGNEYTVSPKSSLFNFDLKKPGRKGKDEAGNDTRVWNPFESKEAKANVQVHYDPVAYAKAYYSGNTALGKYLNERNKVGQYLTNKSASEQFNSEYVDTSIKGAKNLGQVTEAKQKAIDAGVENSVKLGKEFSAHTTEWKKKLKEVQDKITTNKSDTEKVKKSIQEKDKASKDAEKLEQDITKWQASGNETLVKQAIQDARDTIQKLERKKVSLSGKKPSQKREAQIADYDRQIEELQTIITSKTSELDSNSVAALTAAKSARRRANREKSQLETETAKLETLLQQLQSRETRLNKRIGMVNPNIDVLLNPKETTFKFNGKVQKLKPTKTFTKESLATEGIFKQGGSINRNKINKFLNYAKG